MLLNILQCIDQPFITKNYMVKNVNSDDAEEPILTYKLRNTTFAYNTVLLYTKLTQLYTPRITIIVLKWLHMQTLILARSYVY